MKITALTQDLLIQIKGQKWIEPLILVGGSALAIQISHRQSEEFLQPFFISMEGLHQPDNYS
jgi:hypothetical protein